MKILCFGSLNLDYVYSVPHFVRAGETLAAFKREEFCGGKGLNQAIALAKAGADVYHAGKIGKDGRVLKDCLERNGVNTDYLIEDQYSPTGHAVIQVSPQGQNSILIYGGANQSIKKEEIHWVLSHFHENDVVLLQNEINHLDYIIDSAVEQGMKVALNPSPIQDRLLAMPQIEKVSWLILNEIEGEALSGKSQPRDICLALQERYPACTVVLTLGDKGVLCCEKSNFESCGIYQVPVVDTTGAGDTFTGYFLASVTSGAPLGQALQLASKASALAVSRPGAADSIPILEEVLKKQFSMGGPLSI